MHFWRYCRLCRKKSVPMMVCRTVNSRAFVKLIQSTFKTFFQDCLYTHICNDKDANSLSSHICGKKSLTEADEDHRFMV